MRKPPYDKNVIIGRLYCANEILFENYAIICYNEGQKKCMANYSNMNCKLVD